MIERGLQSEAYKGFFGSESGQAFIKELDRIIASSYAEAELSIDATEAFGLIKQAAGIRLVKEHINILMQDVKKGKS